MVAQSLLDVMQTHLNDKQVPDSLKNAIIRDPIDFKSISTEFDKSTEKEKLLEAAKNLAQEEGHNKGLNITSIVYTSMKSSEIDPDLITYIAKNLIKKRAMYVYMFLLVKIKYENIEKNVNDLTAAINVHDAQLSKIVSSLVNEVKGSKLIINKVIPLLAAWQETM